MLHCIAVCQIVYCNILSVREHIYSSHIMCCGIHAQFLKELPLRFVVNYEYLKRNEMKRRMLIITISSIHTRTTTCTKCHYMSVSDLLSQPTTNIHEMYVEVGYNIAYAIYVHICIRIALRKGCKKKRSKRSTPYFHELRVPILSVDDEYVYDILVPHQEYRYMDLSK